MAEQRYRKNLGLSWHNWDSDNQTLKLHLLHACFAGYTDPLSNLPLGRFYFSFVGSLAYWLPVGLTSLRHQLEIKGWGRLNWGIYFPGFTPSAQYIIFPFWRPYSNQVHFSYSCSNLLWVMLNAHPSSLQTMLIPPSNAHNFLTSLALNSSQYDW